jgi:hypothetical protein
MPNQPDFRQKCVNFSRIMKIARRAILSPTGC